MKESMKPNLPDLENLLFIDWELGKKLAGNKIDLAEDLLEMLVKSLPDDLAQIKTLYNKQDYSELLKAVHKLHGAFSYCGTPRLKIVAAHLESNLKNNIINDLSTLLNQLDFEVSNLLERYHQVKILNA
jgi:two-component system sensor histidine kinase BarA